ncbi:hypothetical protein [Kordiimonas marina]|uniref:hypothetical protein n=1 Tax=Kordiimonas marina TaxID=2872312 RepID=UPI001FF304B2|nr:hypothetical protein [Kordiimonas marina]MCJ9429108.1 hypothetical protein [Kordiimonas marina]
MFTLEKPSLMLRVGTGKLVGLLVGLIGFFALPSFYPDTGLMFRLGVLCWYTTMGAVVGMFGVVTYHPVLKLPMPWWFRSLTVGAWMNFVLTLFLHDRFSAMMVAVYGEGSLLSSPWWMVAEGAVVGLICGFVATRVGGEGKETVGR